MQKEKNYFIIKLEKTDINCKIAEMEDVRNKLTQKSNMNLIDNQMFDWMGRFISCTVTSLIIFQYFDDRFLRVYRSKAVYIVLKIICCLANLGVYLLNNPVINLSYWLFVIIVASFIFYYDDNISKVKHCFINVAFLFAYSVCEAIGGIVANVGMSIFAISQKQAIINFVTTISGSASAILLHFLMLKRLFIKEKIRKISVKQYTIYATITAYVLINIGEILFLIRHELSDKDYIFLILDAIFIIFINLYLFYVLDTLDENKDLKYKIALYERQAQSNYEYYMRQMESRKTVLSVIHDVKKHINVLKELKQESEWAEIQNYSKAFENMVAPLLLNQFCENTILNIIINDKMDYCRKNGIQFEVEIQGIQIDFMKPIDVTTIVGNLLDNAVEACEKAKNRHIILKMHPFNGFTCLQISNTYAGEIKWDGKGRPISKKGQGHGIGLENVEKVLKNYNGAMQLIQEDAMFMVKIIFNQP